MNVSCGLVMHGGDQWKVFIAYKYCGIIEEGGEIIMYDFGMQEVVVVVVRAGKALPSIRLCGGGLCHRLWWSVERGVQNFNCLDMAALPIKASFIHSRC